LPRLLGGIGTCRWFRRIGAPAQQGHPPPAARVPGPHPGRPRVRGELPDRPYDTTEQLLVGTWHTDTISARPSLSDLFATYLRECGFNAVFNYAHRDVLERHSFRQYMEHQGTTQVRAPLEGHFGPQFSAPLTMDGTRGVVSKGQSKVKASTLANAPGPP